MKFKKYIPAGMILTLLTTCCLLFFSPLFSPRNTTTSEDERFAAFTQNLFHSQISSDTLNLHYLFADPAAQGIKTGSASFCLYSPESEMETFVTLENVHQALSSFDRAALSPKHQLTFDILTYQIKQELRLASFSYYKEIFSPTLGIQAQLPILLAEYTFYSQQDVEDYLALLCQLDAYYESLLTYQKKKAEAGRFMANETADLVIAQCQAFLSNPEDHFLLTTFEDRIQASSFLSGTEKYSYQNDNRTAVFEHVFPAYEKLIRELSLLKGSGTNPYGLAHYDQGRDYYEALIACTTGTGRNMEDLITFLDTRIQTDLTSIASILTKHPDLIKTTAQTIEPLEPNYILDVLEQKISADFPALHTAPCTIKYVDSSLEEYLSPAFYLTPPLDRMTEHVIYINPAGEFDSLSLFTTLAHEGYPGHLYQTVYEHSMNLNPVRNLFYFGGYIEGWATYVEMLSYSYAGLEPDMAKLLSANSFLSLGLHARADVGIHYEGWTPKETLTFFSNYGIDNSKTIETIYWAIVQDPGNYLKYYLGAAEILSLKEKVQAEQKETFILKEFHECLLQIGPAPFPIIETYLQNGALP